jgi:hypothetical protein
MRGLRVRELLGTFLHSALAKRRTLRLSPATPLYMNRHFLPVLALGFAALFLTALRLPAAGLTENEILKLPSGRTVKVLSVSKVEYSKGVMALMVRYQTSLSVDQHKALSDEVDEVWKCAAKDAERAGYSEAIISSNEVPKGIFVTANRMLNFIFEKGADGKWIRLNRAESMAAQ